MSLMIPPADIPALAARFQRFGALAQAEQLYRQALRTEPDDAELWAGLGRVCQALGRPDEAVTSLRRALSWTRDRVLSNDLGVALMEQGRLDEALDCFDEPRDSSRDPKRTTTRASSGSAGRSRWGRALLPPAFLLDPTTRWRLPPGRRPVRPGRVRPGCRMLSPGRPAPARTGPGVAQPGPLLRGLGQHDEAVSCYERAAQLRPEDPGPLAELAAMLMHRGELEAAVARYEQALRLWPDCVGAYSNMGLALMALGRLEEARLSFEQALYLQPDLAEAHNNLGLALLNQGRVAERGCASSGRSNSGRTWWTPGTTLAWRATPRVSPIGPWLPSSTPCGSIPTILGRSPISRMPARTRARGRGHRLLPPGPGLAAG